MKRYRFVADVHLFYVAKYLRVLGYDTLYFYNIEDSKLLDLVYKEERVLLTRDKELFLTSERGCYLVKATDKIEQLREIVQRFSLGCANLFSRCIKDNEPLTSVDKEEILDRLPPAVAKTFKEFKRCPSCGRVYWQGTHFERMREFLLSICRRRYFYKFYPDRSSLVLR